MINLKARLIAPWLGDENATTLGIKIARRALQDIGVCEDPPGSNRGFLVDAYNSHFGSPLGSPWCANAAGVWYDDCGARVPPSPGNCDQWLKYANAWNCFSDVPGIGYVILYGTKLDVIHVGVVVRTNPYVLVVEGNTTLSGFSKNGEIVTLKSPQAKVIGYFKPTKKL